MFPRISPRFEAYIAPARVHSEIWRLLLGVVLLIAVYLVTSILVMATGRGFGLDPGAVFEGKGSAAETALILLSFVGLVLGVALAARVFQQRGLSGLFGPDPVEFRLHFTIAATAVLTLAVLVQAYGLAFSQPQSHLPLLTWLGWLPVSLTLILIQSASEELLFRGYLQSQLAARFRSPLVWWLLPSLLFGLLHYDPSGYGPNAWLVVADTALFGLVAADLTARTGNLGAAIGLHFVNNAMAILFIAPAGDMNGLALNVTSFGVNDWDAMRTALLSDMAVIVVGYLVYLYLIGRRGL